MKYIALSFKTTNASEFVSTWAAAYKRQEKPNSRVKYNSYISARPCTIESITKLLQWKNSDRFENFSANKKKLVQEILEKIHVINQLESNWDKNLFRTEFKPDKNGPIWKLFILHVIQPEIFPIFDQHVYRAQHFLQSGKIIELSATHQSRFDLFMNEYLPVFNAIKTESNASLKEVHEAMWAFGLFLKKNKQLIEA
jgi:hypothetical protein